MTAADNKSQVKPRPGSGKSRGKTAANATTSGGRKSVTPREDADEGGASSALPPYPEAGALAKEKLYEPTTFAGQHISDIVRENEELKVKVRVL